MNSQGKGGKLWGRDKVERLLVVSHAGHNRSWDKAEPNKVLVDTASSSKRGRIAVDCQVCLCVVTHSGCMAVL